MASVGDVRNEVTETVSSMSESDGTNRSLHSLISPSNLLPKNNSSSSRDIHHPLDSADSHKVYPKRMSVFSPTSSPSLPAHKGVKRNLSLETDHREGASPQGSIEPIVSPDGKNSVYSAYQNQSKQLSEQIHSDMRRSTLVVMTNVFLCYIVMLSIVFIYQNMSLS
jgi:hypothetical protein